MEMGDDVHYSESERSSAQISVPVVLDLVGPSQVAAEKPRKPVAEMPASSPTPAWMEGAPEIPEVGLIVTPGDIANSSRPEVGELTLPALVKHVAQCEACKLCETRKNTVPGVGDPNANFMIIGEGPGQNEDEQGEPFVGRAGKLLDDIIGAIGLSRADVYIANMVKCRPPENRNPTKEEVEACIPFLYRQIQLIEPKVILAVGAVAAGSLLGTKKSLGQMRKNVHEFMGIPLVATYHPAALLRNPNWKRPTWDDVRIARRILDRDS